MKTAYTKECSAHWLKDDTPGGHRPWHGEWRTQEGRGKRSQPSTYVQTAITSIHLSVLVSKCDTTFLCWALWQTANV